MREMSIRIVSVLALIGLPACGGSGTAPDAGGPDAGRTCHAPVADAAPVPECTATSLCLDSSQAVVVDSAHCTAATCRWTYQANAGDTLTYDGGDTWVFIRFTGRIAGATTTDQLSAAAPAVNFYRQFPVTGGTNGLEATYFDQRTGVASFDLFELSRSMLHVKVSFTVKDPYAWIQSQDAACVAGDVGGMCICTYDGVDIPGSIDVDLPADIPAS